MWLHSRTYLRIIANLPIFKFIISYGADSRLTV
jgi:hypothetical protein